MLNIQNVQEFKAATREFRRLRKIVILGDQALTVGHNEKEMAALARIIRVKSELSRECRRPLTAAWLITS